MLISRNALCGSTFWKRYVRYKPAFGSHAKRRRFHRAMNTAWPADRKIVYEYAPAEQTGSLSAQLDDNCMPLNIKTINPEELGAPLGLYRQVSRVQASEFILIAGQLAVDRTGGVVGKGNFTAQMHQVFSNIGAGLRAVGCQFSNVIKFTTYLVHSQDIERFMEVRKELFPKLFTNETYPPNTLLIVDRLVRKDRSEDN